MALMALMDPSFILSLKRTKVGLINEEALGRPIPKSYAGNFEDLSV
jgi:hypothetical protein